MIHFRANNFAFSLSQDELLKDGQPVRLPPMALKFLNCLVGRPGHVVTKDELLENVWGDTTKSDEVITSVLHDLRAALDDQFQSPTFIKTVHGKGYKFVAEIDKHPGHPSNELQVARIHGTKFDVPRRSEFWDALPRDAQQRFRLVGNSNKNWISLDAGQAKALGDAINRICLDGGSVGILSGTDPKHCIEPTRSFLKHYVFNDRHGETWSAKAKRLNALIDGLDYSVIDNINYRAVVSDGRALIIPLLNTSQFRDQSMVIEITENDHPGIFRTYLGDIDRLRRTAKNYFPALWAEEFTGGRLHHVANRDDLLANLRSLGIVASDLVFYVTSRCNLRCKHCYIGDALLKDEHFWTRQTIRSLIGGLELDRLTVVGGEPLLYPGIEDVLEAAAIADIKERRLTTNLTDVTDGQIATIKQTGFRACVSLDGATALQHDGLRGRGQFEKTVANLQRLVSAGVDVEVTHTVTTQNATGFQQLIDLLRRLGIRRLNLHKVSPQGNAMQIQNRSLIMTPTAWRTFLNKIVFTVPSGKELITVRYPWLFATRQEYQNWSNDEGYHHHALGSFYSTRGHRVVLYPDGKVFVSSEAFGTECFVGRIADGRFEANEGPRNEMRLAAESAFRVSDVNEDIRGDENYPFPLSFSYRRSLQL